MIGIRRHLREPALAKQPFNTDSYSVLRKTRALRYDSNPAGVWGYTRTELTQTKSQRLRDLPMSTPPPRFTAGIHHLTVDRSSTKPGTVYRAWRTPSTHRAAGWRYVLRCSRHRSRGSRDASHPRRSASSVPTILTLPPETADPKASCSSLAERSGGQARKAGPTVFG